jgi:oligoendopeptidase F
MTPTGAESVRWNLADLYADTAALRADVTRTLEGADALSSEYRGRLATLDAPGTAALMQRLEGLHDAMGRAYTYAYLDWSTDTTDPSRGALLQEVREAYARFQQALVFVEVEWAALPAEEARTRYDHPMLARYRHSLELQTLRAAHVRSEAEEKLLAETDVTGRDAWTRFFDQTLAAARFTLDGVTLTEQEVLARLHDPDRDVRRAAAHAFTQGLNDLAPTLAFVFNTLTADKAAKDRLRGYDTWLSARNQSNEVDDAVVKALVSAVVGRYGIAQRYYRLKARLLGLDVMEDYDRYAPLPEADTFHPWDEAVAIVQAAYDGFHPEAGAVVRRFFEERWIDAPAAPGKRGGAFSHGAVPSAHPYVLMNYTGRARDVQTLAHELGHGLHQYLARDQGVFHADTPLTTAETASVFGEMITHRRVLDGLSDGMERLALLVSRLDDTMATVFRQVSMNRFEDALHTARRDEGELSTERLDALWMETQRTLYGDAVRLGDHYARWWSYIPHFVHTPGYVYAYAFGELLVLALYARYEAEGPDFAPKYLDLLRAGGSDWPHVLVARLGVDLTDPAFWNGGLDTIERLVEEAETLAGGVEG